MVSLSVEHINLSLKIMDMRNGSCSDSLRKVHQKEKENCPEWQRRREGRASSNKKILGNNVDDVITDVGDLKSEKSIGLKTLWEVQYIRSTDEINSIR